MAMNNFAEQPLADNDQDSQIVTTEAPVFEHHTGDLGLLGCIDQVPAFIESIGGGDFDANVFARFHGVNGHRGVPTPGSGDDNGVDVISVHKLLKGIFILIVAFGLAPAGFDDHILGGGEFFEVNITKGGDLDSVYFQQVAKQTWATAAKSNNPDPDGFDIGG